MRLDFLRPLYESLGGYVSIYLDTSRAVESGPHEAGLRWRAARQQLSGDGADQATLDAIENLLTEPDPDDPARGAPGHVVFARNGTIVFQAPLPEIPRQQIARFAPLPHVLPWLAQYPPPAPHVLVSADRTGGDVVTVTGSEPPRVAGPDHVTGDQWPVHKTPGGGWSQARYQRSVEESWDENAKLTSWRTSLARSWPSTRPPNWPASWRSGTTCSAPGARWRGSPTPWVRYTTARSPTCSSLTHPTSARQYSSDITARTYRPMRTSSASVVSPTW